jgi:leucyl/phenylalanyl-tRNA--protein transferase
MRHGQAHPRPLTREEHARVDAVLEMYRQGWFPMYEHEDDKVHWVQPRRRGIVPLQADRFHVPRTLRARVRGGRFTLTTDAAFGEVIRACAAPAPGRESTWLSPDIVELYELLHCAGLAHSVEAWLGEGASRVLVGGLYGLAVGSVFCGESMFSRPDRGGTDASKVCLVHLVHHLRRRGFTMLDAQLTNRHLAQFGSREIPQTGYLAHVEAHAGDERPWQPWEPEATVRDLAR